MGIRSQSAGKGRAWSAGQSLSFVSTLWFRREECKVVAGQLSHEMFDDGHLLAPSKLLGHAPLARDISQNACRRDSYESQNWSHRRCKAMVLLQELGQAVFTLPHHPRAEAMAQHANDRSSEIPASLGLGGEPEKSAPLAYARGSRLGLKNYKNEDLRLEPRLGSDS